MSDVTVPLTVDVARAIIIGVAKDAQKYNKQFAWWSHEAIVGKSYKFGEAVVSLEQVVYPEESRYGERADSETELVWKIADRYFRVEGDYSSYGGEKWDDLTFREVKPTKVTRQVFDFV